MFCGGPNQSFGSSLNVWLFFKCSCSTSHGEMKRQLCPEACSVVVMADRVYLKHMKWNISFIGLGFFLLFLKEVATLFIAMSAPPFW